MTIDNELYQKIRQLYQRDKLSQRRIAKQLHVSRKTVSKYCEGGCLPGASKTLSREKPVTSVLRKAVEVEILKLLEENQTAPKKQRLTAHDIWNQLRKVQGFNIGESTVRRYLRELRQIHPEVFIPLDFEPGEVMQFDFGEAYAYIAAVKTLVSIFCSVLPYSYGIHCSVFPDKTNLSFFTGHVQTFEFFGGVACRGIYDNLKNAVLSGSGKDAIKQEEFKKLEAHYAFEAVFCGVAAGWEKGAVENLVEIIRKIAFTPVPRVNDFLELQQLVTSRCLEYCETHRLKSRDRSIKEMLAEERQHLMPLPAVPFDPAKIVTALVHSDLTVWFDNIKYSVPFSLAGKTVTLRVTPYHVQIYHQGSLIYTHKKGARPHDHQYVTEHYLEILERKSRAVPNALPLKKGVMPKELTEFMKLNTHKDKYRQLLSVFLLGREIEREKLLWAVKQANASGCPTYEMVCFYLQLSNSTVEKIKTPVTVDQVDLTRYDQLITGGGPPNER